MNATAFCLSCGAQIASTDRFCSACGEPQPVDDAPTTVEPSAEPGLDAAPRADQDGVSQADASAQAGAGNEPTTATTPPQPPPPRPAERIEAIAPGAGELGRQLSSAANLPGVAPAAIVGAITAAACLVGGFLLTLIAGDGSTVELRHDSLDGGLVNQSLIQATRFALAPTVFGIDGGEALRMAPLLLAIVPVAAAALAAERYLPATLAGRPAVLWGVLTAVPFAVLMLLMAVIGRLEDPDFTELGVNAAAGSTFLLALALGAIGGAIGVARALKRRGGPLEELLPPLSPKLQRAMKAAFATVRSAGLLLALTLVIAGGLALVQSLRGVNDHSQPKGAAVLDAALYAGEHAVHGAQLGALVGFEREVDVWPVLDALELEEPVLAQPIPVTDGDPFAPGGGDRTFSIFAYADAVPFWAFIPMLTLIVAVLVAALYSGFSAARAVGAAVPAQGAAWGALTGPVWALLFVVLNALLADVPFGTASGESTFLNFLFGGAAAGALGGFLATGGLAAASGVGARPAAAQARPGTAPAQPAAPLPADSDSAASRDGETPSAAAGAASERGDSPEGALRTDQASAIVPPTNPPRQAKSSPPEPQRGPSMNTRVAVRRRNDPARTLAAIVAVCGAALLLAPSADWLKDGMGFFSFDGSTVSRELDVSVNWIYLGAALALAGGIVYAAWWQIVGFALGLLGGAATLLVAGLAIDKFLDEGVDVEHFAEGLWLATAGGALALVLSLAGLIIASAGGIAPSQTGAPVSHAEPPSEPR